jgi:hypothetical protein
MGPLADQLLVNGTLPEVSNRGSCRDDFLEGDVYRLQLQALKKWRGHVVDSEGMDYWRTPMRRE